MMKANASQKSIMIHLVQSILIVPLKMLQNTRLLITKIIPFSKNLLRIPQASRLNKERIKPNIRKVSPSHQIQSIVGKVCLFLNISLQLLEKRIIRRPHPCRIMKLVQRFSKRNLSFPLQVHRLKHSQRTILILSRKVYLTKRKSNIKLLINKYLHIIRQIRNLLLTDQKSSSLIIQETPTFLFFTVTSS